MHDTILFPLWVARLWRWSLLLLLGMTAGCGPDRSKESEAAHRALPPLPPSAPLSDAWTGSTASWVETALAPALLLHSTAREVRFFVPHGSSTNTVPRYLAFGANGPKLVTNGNPATVTKMQERWILVWFGEAAGWEKGDCPLGIFLQHPLQDLEFNSRGLTLRFAGEAGDVALMPVYGARPLPVSPDDLAALPISREERRKLPRVWEWTKSVPRDPLTRLRYWSSVLAKFPFAAWGCWSHDPSQPQLLRFYGEFHHHSIPFTWTVSPLVVAPIPSGLAELTRLKPAPVVTSQRVFDMDWPGLAAPLYTVPEVPSFSIEPGTVPGGLPQFKASVGQDLHLSPRVQGEANLHSEGWREWTFDPQFASDSDRSVLRFEPVQSRLEWGHALRTRIIRQSLGEVWFDGARPEGWDLIHVNPNTRILRSRPARERSSP